MNVEEFKSKAEKLGLTVSKPFAWLRASISEESDTYAVFFGNIAFGTERQLVSWIEFEWRIGGRVNKMQLKPEQFAALTKTDIRALKARLSAFRSRADVLQKELLELRPTLKKSIRGVFS